MYVGYSCPWLYVTLLHLLHDRSNWFSTTFSSTTLQCYILTLFIYCHHYIILHSRVECIRVGTVVTLAPWPFPIFCATLRLSIQQPCILNKVQYLADGDFSSHLVPSKTKSWQLTLPFLSLSLFSYSEPFTELLV